MSKTNETSGEGQINPVVQPGQMTQEEFAAAIGGAVAQGIQAGTRRKVTFGEYDPKSPFQKGLSKNALPKLVRECYQNGSRIDATKCFPEEINLLNRISRSGRYLDRRVEVVLREEGSETILDIRYSNKGPQQLELKSYARNFLDMLQQIVAAQDEENAEEEARKPARRSSGFGNTKATREAREAAEA